MCFESNKKKSNLLSLQKIKEKILLVLNFVDFFCCSVGGNLYMKNELVTSFCNEIPFDNKFAVDSIIHFHLIFDVWKWWGRREFLQMNVKSHVTFLLFP